MKSNQGMIAADGGLYHGSAAQGTKRVVFDCMAPCEPMKPVQAERSRGDNVKNFHALIMGSGGREGFEEVPESASLVLLGLGPLLIRRNQG